MKIFETFATVRFGLIRIGVESGMKFQLTVICVKIFTINFGYIVPEVVLNGETFLIITIECFSGLLYSLKIVLPLSIHLPLKHVGFVPPNLMLKRYFILHKSGITRFVPARSLENSPIISLNSIKRLVVLV
jgi:hypothetical protein